jgi:hypothetical protein
VTFLTEVELTPAERKVYDRLCQGDVMCKDLTPWESGAVPSLVQKGLAEIYKLNMSNSRVKMLKFLRLRT